MFSDKFKKGFTLAEVMIVLTVIGVITAVIMPITSQMIPDKNIMKFKKGNSVLYSTIRNLIESNKYYKDGDLGMKADGNLITDRQYFCQSFADVISTKDSACQDIGSTSIKNYYQTYDGVKAVGEGDSKLADLLDTACENVQTVATNTNYGLTTVDKIRYYEGRQANLYGCIKTNDTSETDLEYCETRVVTANAGNREYGQTSKTDYRCIDDGANTAVDSTCIGHLTLYRVFCMDIDGINNGEDPFGYGIRVDGKILAGTRALEWSKKNFKGNE